MKEEKLISIKLLKDDQQKMYNKIQALLNQDVVYLRNNLNNVDSKKWL